MKKTHKMIGGVAMNELAINLAYHHKRKTDVAERFFAAVGHERYRMDMTGSTGHDIETVVVMINNKPVEGFEFDGYLLTKYKPVRLKGWRRRVMEWLLK